MRLLVLPITVAFLMSSCGQNVSVPTAAERVIQMTNLLERKMPLPGPILEAEYLEEQVGNGFLAPSDFYFFAKLIVSKDDFGLWKSVTGEKIAKWDYLTPKADLPWWPTKSEAEKLLKFSPKQMFGRSHGWVGFSSDNKTIYVLTFEI